MNDRPEHTAFRELLNLELDGRLTAEQRVRLDRHLDGCPECRAEREQLLALADLLQRSALVVQPDFSRRVMAAMPPAGWESRHPRTWSFPIAAFGALLAAGAALLGAGSARLGSAYGVLSALGGLAQAALVAGVGVTAASWRWFQMFVEQLLASPASLVVFGVFVVCLNLVLFSLIRRGGRRGARAVSAAPPAGGAGAGGAAGAGRAAGGRRARGRRAR
ncbi:MAG TPA: zf-HC2 domain-containing protein [Thermoanaerobaculia bacterium]|nr:zf-HC2 domain-containing protein [Thermoanaerobaculia bacterium]